LHETSGSASIRQECSSQSHHKTGGQCRHDVNQIKAKASAFGKLEAAPGFLLAEFLALDDAKIMSTGMREWAHRS
jgi:hypothetical protein